MINVNHFAANRTYAVSQQGNTLQISDPTHENCRCPGDFYYSLEVASDQVKLSGQHPEMGMVDYSIMLSPQGATVSEAKDRSSYTMMTQTDNLMSPEQQQQFGVSVAGSLIGVPLFFDATLAGSGLA